jgi:hypothetical protein
LGLNANAELHEKDSLDSDIHVDSGDQSGAFSKGNIMQNNQAVELDQAMAGLSTVDQKVVGES